MQRLSGMLFAAGLTALVAGCGQGSSEERRASRADGTQNVELSAQAIKLGTQREMDEFKKEAQDALQNARGGLKTVAKKRADEMSAFAAEIAEEAKDRAVDIPDVVDRALERHTRRWRERQSVEPANDE